MHNDNALAETLLEKRLNRKYSSQIEIWRMDISSDESIKKIVRLGLGKMKELVGFNNVMYLHGWIDQAVLEISEVDLCDKLIDKMIHYRPDEGGDSGILHIKNEKLIYLFELLFESECA